MGLGVGISTAPEKRGPFNPTFSCFTFHVIIDAFTFMTLQFALCIWTIVTLLCFNVYALEYNNRENMGNILPHHDVL